MLDLDELGQGGVCLGEAYLGGLFPNTAGIPDGTRDLLVGSGAPEVWPWVRAYDYDYCGAWATFQWA